LRCRRAFDTAKISSTIADASVNAPSAGVGYATWQSLTDVTGDGRPDLVFPRNGKLWVACNRPGSGGTTTLGAGQAVAPLADATFAEGAFEARAATNNRFTYGASHVNVDKVWSSFSAGFGDAVRFWCPGCGSFARSQWGIESGDADGWSYMFGSITGIVGVVFRAETHVGGCGSQYDNVGDIYAQARWVNPTGCQWNCVNTAITMDLRLAGRPASALPQIGGTLEQLEAFAGRTAVGMSDVSQIMTTVEGWGQGSRGIVIGYWGKSYGHVFNVVNRNGMIVFVDGQGSGYLPIWSAYTDGLALIRTH
jgi:Papain fold toxin 1, glutamine deamidase